MFSNRQKKILLYLTNTNQPVTAIWISKELNVSDRTIRNDLKDIQMKSASLGLKLELIRGKGHKVTITDKELFNQKFLELSNNELRHTTIDFSEQENRIFYLLNRFLLENSYIKLETIEEEMFVSKSTIQNDLKEVRKILTKYNQSLVNRPHYGLYVDGDEFMKRMCLSNYLYKREEKYNSPHEEIPLFDKKVYKKFKEIIIEKVNKYKIEISDIALDNLTIHIVIACKRIEEGFTVEQPLLNLKDDYPLEKIVAKEIVKKIEAYTGLLFPNSEINYIIIHLLGTKLFPNESLSEFSKFDEVKSILHCMLKRLQNELNWDFHEDFEFIQALTLHIRPAMNRLRYKMNIRNPLLTEIKVKYPAAFEGALIASKCIKEHLNLEVGEHEVAYIALHIGVALERMKNKTRKIKRVILVCASGIGSAKLLYYRLINLFEQDLQVVNTISYYKLAESDLSSIDFIISTVPIDKDVGIPIIVVNTFLEGEDIKRVRNVLSTSKQLDETHTYLNPSRIFVKKELATKESVIHFLSNELVKLGLVPDHYESLVLEREALAPTSFGNLVAIPHPSIPVTKETFWTICTLKRPIRWDDKQMVQLICLLNIKEGNTTDLDKMYKKLISLIEDKEIVQQIISKNTVEEILEIII
ncbi:BglG family transcription antiterminator [Neobacillus cucumis]|uniref:BglG family transcription antiterminator n=1 Tax=Neobacillus cucumis TaxID=1740721 RepID=UPI0020415D1B|nr:BglG family transcription antiterminator [Neobacillus cucumis]MCM3729883.1 BglG family transcription antiterminator [Neobacillus cucumis]